MMIGAHLSNKRPLADARAIGAELIQVFLSNPQSWKKPLPRPDAEELASSPTPIYVHAPYLVNVVAGESRVRIPSRRILAETCEAATAIGAAGVVVHGGHVTGGGSLGEATGRWRKALTQLDTTVPVLIENTASGQFAAARRLEDIRRLWEEIGDLDVGLVLDTCHAWVAGYDLAGDFEGVWIRADDTFGVHRVELFHLNDARTLFGSRLDRHANIGEGTIGLEPFRRIMKEDRFRSVPKILETPKGDDGVTADRMNLRLLRSLRTEQG